MYDLGVIGGRFRVERACGSGAMGSVYRARDDQTGLPVAVKVLRDDHPQLRQRFDREARTLATLEHPNIVRYVAHGATDADLPYLVMEWIEGETLTARLGRTGLTGDETVAMGAAVADALAAAHAHAVVHRDVKPSNLLFVAGDAARVKLIDFGVARASAETYRLTDVGSSVGTPGYMAPEQVRSMRDVDPRADLFALGCVLYECFSGRRAFSGSDAMEVWIKIVLAQPTSLRLLAPGLPEPLIGLIEQLLAKEPTARPADAVEVAAALRQVGPILGEPRRLVAHEELPTLVVTRAPLPGTDDRTQQGVAHSVFLVVATEGGDPDTAGTVDSERSAGERRRASISASVDRLAAAHGAQADCLAEGSVVITFEAQEPSVEAAAAAAACALALRTLMPGAMIALTSGTGPEGSPVLDDVIARGLRLIEAVALETVTGRGGAAEGVQLDDVTARLLGAGFDVRATATGSQLRGPIRAVRAG